MRKKDLSDHQSSLSLETGNDRAPDGGGVMLAVLAGTLCWVGLLALFL